jgi:hypothetical protein
MKGCYTQDLSMFQGIIAPVAFLKIAAKASGQNGKLKNKKTVHIVVHTIVCV